MGRLIYLLDTNIVSEVSKLHANKVAVHKLAAMKDSCAISSISWFESLYGIEIMPNGKRKNDLEKFTYEVIQNRYPIIPYDEHAASVHSKIAAELRKTGKSRPYADTQIAAIAIANNMILVTHNTADFEGIPLLATEDWIE